MKRTPILSRLLRIIALVALVATLPACSDNPAEPEDDGRVFEFAIRGRTDDFNFAAKTSDPDVIADVEAQLNMPAEQRSRFINGPIEAGDGDHNFDWEWHFVPDQWELTDFSIELCDGNPKLVEDDLNYWLNTVERFCPWGSYVVREITTD